MATELIGSLEKATPTPTNESDKYILHIAGEAAGDTGERSVEEQIRVSVGESLLGAARKTASARRDSGGSGVANESMTLVERSQYAQKITETTQQFGCGVGSYFRGVFRAFRQEARRLGYLGAADAVAVMREDEILEKITGVALANPTLVWEAAKYSVSSNRARVIGRATAALAVNLAVGPFIGTSGSVLAAYGDASYAIEVGTRELGPIVENILAAPR